MIFLATTEFQLLYTNDLHSHFDEWPKIVSLIKDRQKHYEELGQDVLLFDIGDHVDRVHPITEATLGKANVVLMNEVGYSGATIGNNEGITISKPALSALYEKANFPVLVANLFHENGEVPNWLKRYEIIALANGLKVGVIGMTIAYQAFYEPLGWRIEDPLLLLPELVSEVREKADFVIFLSHLGINLDEEVAKKVDGIDVILGGHTHQFLEEQLIINNTVIHQAGKFGKCVGQLSIHYDLSKHKMINCHASLLNVTDYQPSQQTVNMLSELSVQSRQYLDEKVVHLKNQLDVSWVEKSELPTVLAAALKEWCQAEIGMVNSGVILDRLKAGDVTKADLHKICPHPINPCKVRLTGQVLKETIKYATSEEMVYKKVRGYGFRGTVMGIMVFDGVTFDTDLLSDGLMHISNIKVNGEPIDRGRLYEVATIDVFTFSHHYPAITNAESKKYYMPELLRDLLAWKLIN